MSQNISVLILAAGKGERMRSELPKVLHPLGGRPLLAHGLAQAKKLKPKRVVILIGHKGGVVQKRFAKEGVAWATQKKQLGTAHAVLCGLEALKEKKGFLYILYADVPFLRVETLQAMKKKAEEGAALVLLTTERSDPTGYGRIIRGEGDEVVRIVEEKEASESEKKICEVNAGIYLARIETIRTRLMRVRKNSVKGEYYLTDLIEMLVREGEKVIALPVKEPAEVAGINSQEELAEMEQILQKKIRSEWMAKGITLLDPGSTRIEGDVRLEPGVLLHPGVVLQGRTIVQRDAEILSYSVIEESIIGPGARIGPFAHLRSGSRVEAGAHVGNFVELKKTRLGKGAKANHLSYIGDAVVGSKVNIGAGTITCNYNGFDKFRTVIGKGAFIGSDTQLVAPVRIGKGAYVGSGTTVTKNVPAGALAISRVEQKNIPGWAKKKRKGREFLGNKGG